MLDRFLSSFPVTRSRVQLIGLTSLLVAAKFEEKSIPSLDDSFVLVSGGAVTKEELVLMEQYLLNALHFLVFTVTPYSFFHHFLRSSPLIDDDSALLAAVSFVF